MESLKGLGVKARHLIGTFYQFAIIIIRSLTQISMSLF